MSPFTLTPPQALRLWILLTGVTCLASVLPSRVEAAAALPAGFSESTIPGPAGGWNEAIGVFIEPTGRLYVWERGGRVWFKDPPDSTFSVLLDIREEVMPFLDHGMIGFVLDPQFRENGHIYVSYAVDRHHLLYHGTPLYNPNTTLAQVATILRVTRYTCQSSDNFRSIDPASRLVLIGESKTTGIPLLSDTHAGGALVFGMDGSLLVSSGDGASPYGADVGGAAVSGYAVQGRSDGIIRPEEDVGSYRSQLLNSHNGKLLRIDPATGNGLPSNPYYDPASPRSPRSRTLALGLRNPYRMVLVPGTGSHLPEDADPGTLMIGDVGWNTWEELNVFTAPRQNFGWPLFEGHTLATLGSYTYNIPVQNLDTPNPLYPATGTAYFNFFDLLKQDTVAASGQPPFRYPSDPGVTIPESIPQFLQRRPILDWNHDNAITRTPSYNGDGSANTINVGAAGSPVAGVPFKGNCSVGGLWYTGTAFPATYHNTYFHVDWGKGLIKNIVLDSSLRPTVLRDFLQGGGFVTCMAQHPIDGSLYYVNFDYSASTIRRIEYTGNRAPVAVATASATFGSEPLTIQFSGAGSSDPDGDPFGYLWNFGDGTTSTAANPSHTFPLTGGTPTGYTVTLTVTDSAGASAQAVLAVATNNTPPSVAITSPSDGAFYDPTIETTVNLTAVVADSESPDSELSYSWLTILHHNDHSHSSPPDSAHTTTTTLSPTGVPDGVTVYYYRVRLAVTDPQGLSTIREISLYPDAGASNTPPTIGAIGAQSTTIGSPVGPIAVVVGDGETPASNLTLSGNSSNTDLLPVSGIGFSGTGTSRTVTLSPTAGQFGTTTVTLTVSDGNLSASTSFPLTVSGSNTAPSISNTLDQVISEDAVLGPISFTISDPETPGSSLSVNAGASDPVLLPPGSITLGGTGATRTITISPAPNRSGVATVTITVSDGSFSTSDTFIVNVLEANDAPTIASMGDSSAPSGGTFGPVSFTVADVDTPLASLIISGSSANETLLPTANLVFGGTDGNRTLTATPAANQTGSTVITLTVSDGSLSASTSFTLTIVAGNAGLAAAYSFDEGSGGTVNDRSGNGNHGTILGATWSGTGKFGSALTFNGSNSLVAVGASASLTLSTAMTIEAWVYPTAAQSGWRTIVQREVDAYFLHASSNNPLRPAAGGTFNGTVAFTSSPTAIPVGVWTHLAVTYDQVATRLYINGTQAASLPVAGLIPSTSSPVRIGGNAPYGEFFLGLIDEVRIYNRSLSGTEILADMNTAVGPPTASPTISPIAPQVAAFATSLDPIAFTISDPDTPASSLTVTGTSSNATLVPNANLVFGGADTNRTLTITPATGQFGNTTVTLTVSDGTSNATTSFTLTVEPPVPVITSPDTATGTVAQNFIYTITASGSPTNYSASGLPSGLVINASTGIITGVPTVSGAFTATLSATNVAGTGTASLALAISPAIPTNSSPTITAIADQATTLNTGVGPIPFSIGDAETSAESLTVSATSSNSTLFPATNLGLGGSGASRSITATPATGEIGTTVITVNVSDGILSASTSFTATVTPNASGGLVAAYTFNENTGGTANDASGNGNHGTISGATWSTIGRYGSALSFNGANSFVVVNASASLNLSAAMTLEAWVLPAAAQSRWRTIIQKEVDAYFLHASSNTPLRPAAGGIFSGAVAFSTSPTAIPVGTWTHLAATYDATMIRLYINGVMVASQARTGTLQSSVTPLRIGGNVPYGEFFLGQIDEVRIYNRALSTVEIQANMNTPVGPASAAPSITPIANQASAFETILGPIAFTVSDSDTPAINLIVSATSSNVALIPNANLTLGGTNPDRTLTVTPASDQFGTSTVTVTVSDSTGSASTSFTVTIAPPLPVITSALTATATVGQPFIYSITASGAPTSYDVSGLPSGLEVNSTTGFISGVPLASGVFNATLSATNATGTGNATLELTINPASPTNSPPTLTPINAQTTPSDTAVGPITFTVGDAESSAASLTVSGTSSNQTLLPNANLSFGGSGETRTLTALPVSGETGITVITVSVSDGILSSSTAFTLTVTGSGDADLVAAYSFNENAGATVNDASGHGNHGTISGASWSAVGRYGSALSFNGTNNLVVVNASASLNLSTAMTLEAWVLPVAAQSGWRTVIQKEVDAYFLHASSNSPLRPAAGGTFSGAVAFSTSPTPIPVGTWTHLAVTFDAAMIRLYSNGVLVASQSRTGVIQSTTTPLRIGGNAPYGEFFLGQIDEVRIYKRALSTAEIQANMNTPVP